MSLTNNFSNSNHSNNFGQFVNHGTVNYGAAKEEEAKGNVHWNIVRPKHPYFTGRDDILLKLEEKLRNAAKNTGSQEQCRIVIHGMGGQGKSELCLQVADRVREMFWGIFWVDVSSTEQVTTGFEEIASRLGKPASSLPLTTVKNPWLLILDNADDPKEDYQQHIPSGKYGAVIITSRNKECAIHSTEDCTIALDKLADEEATELLLKAARITASERGKSLIHAQTVAKLLGSHPLALIQAGTYVSRGFCSLAGYPHVYEKQRKRLLTFRPSQAQSRYRDVYATFEVSAEVLAREATEAASDALQLVSVLAMLGQSRLTVVIFELAWERAQCVKGQTEK